MTSQIYLCVDLKTIVSGKQMTPGEARQGALIYRDQDHFSFVEATLDFRPRNVKVWKGERLKVMLTPEGELKVRFKRIILDATTDPLLIADQIFVELQDAKRALGMARR